MGLDMYLTRKVYIGAEYEHNKVTGSVDIQKDGKPVKINFNKISYIEESAAYWRKANHIHKWFVDNVQGGEDDCKDYYVSREQLQELVNTCKKVLEIAKTKEGNIHVSTSWAEGKRTENYEDGKVIENQEEVAEILPTASGFFFGGTDYDEYYLRDIQNTIDQLEPLLADTEDNGEYEYSSSW